MRTSTSRRSDASRRGLAAALAAMLAVLPAAFGTPAPGPRGAGRGLVARLSAAGRAEARIERSTPDPLSGRARVAAGVLALEIPDRARLDFDRERESVTLRGDGGEWLQPALHQMIRFGPESARIGLRWWGVMLGSDAGAHEERPLGGGRFLLTLPAAEGAPGDSAWVTLGADGLPRRLEIAEADGEHAVYRLRNWRFLKARGKTAFVLRAPEGFEVVDMR